MAIPLNILLLTNRDSDNVGDQLIEATVISLISAAMENIGVKQSGFKINSRAAGIISRKYMSTGDESLLTDARNSIINADLVVFGGAPLFNYAYQNFYLRTIRTIELAQEYDVPVLFSSIGVEPYSETNVKSQRLKKALHLPVVRQITTRDDIAALRKYLEDTEIPHSLVSDPAVFTRQVFDAVVPARKTSGEKTGRTIGLVVTRAGIFSDNGIDFSEDDQRQFWLEVIDAVQSRGDDVRLFTTGHFSDEVFLDSLVRESGIPASKVKFAVNSPEELLSELARCDGVIAYRLHASIAAFSYQIPAVGLSWNFKVPYFYETVGYPERAISWERWNAEAVLAALDTAMLEGVTHDAEFLHSVYQTIFDGIKGVFAPGSRAVAYDIDQLRSKLPRYKGTTHDQYVGKLQRKLRRTYENYQKLARKSQSPATLESKAKTLRDDVPQKLKEIDATTVVTGAPTGEELTASLAVRLASAEKRLVAAEKIVADNNKKRSGLEKRVSSSEVRLAAVETAIKKLQNLFPIRLWRKLRTRKR